jgi:2-oxoglutarate ferredoxin oxidoreductase subunit gamma
LSESSKIFARRGEIGIRIGGSGGQGAVLAASILGEAAVAEGLCAAGSSSYGSQARGGAASSDLILSRGPIDYPHVSRPDVFVGLSQEAYDESAGKTDPQGIILYDSFFVKPKDLPGIRQVAVPATRSVLEKLGAGQNANIFMLGVVIGATGVVREEAVVEAIESNMDARFKENSRTAFRMGMEFAATW